MKIMDGSGGKGDGNEIDNKVSAALVDQGMGYLLVHYRLLELNKGVIQEIRRMQNVME